MKTGRIPFFGDIESFVVIFEKLLNTLILLLLEERIQMVGVSIS